MRARSHLKTSMHLKIRQALFSIFHQFCNNLNDSELGGKRASEEREGGSERRRGRNKGIEREEKEGEREKRERGGERDDRVRGRGEDRELGEGGRVGGEGGEEKSVYVCA